MAKKNRDGKPSAFQIEKLKALGANIKMFKTYRQAENFLRKAKKTTKPTPKPVAKPTAKPTTKPTAKPSIRRAPTPRHSPSNPTKPTAKPTAKKSVNPIVKPCRKNSKTNMRSVDGCSVFEFSIPDEQFKAVSAISVVKVLRHLLDAIECLKSLYA